MSEKQGLLFIVSGPSGCGKDTVLQRLMERHEDVRVSVSATTRAPREGEVDGPGLRIPYKRNLSRYGRKGRNIGICGI